MEGKELEQALAHDSARKTVEPRISAPNPHTLTHAPAAVPGTDKEPYMPDDGAAMYPPNIKPLHLRKGQIAALIWEDRGSCHEVHLHEGEARPMRLKLAGEFLTAAGAIGADEDTKRKLARGALALADILIEEAGR